MNKIIILIMAYGLDISLGDPETWPHPVKLMGHYIIHFQSISQFKQKSSKQQFYLGMALWFSLLILIIVMYLLLSLIASALSPLFKFLMDLYLVYTCLSVKALAQEAEGVATALTTGGLEAGRKQVSRIVGRQTDKLSQGEVIQATIETVAENTSDGFVAPIFYCILFGPLGSLIYKGVNTLDSMVAYRNDQYFYFGKFSAWMDDLWNFIPARLTALLMIFATIILGYSYEQTVRIWWRDRRQHASPNAGHPEAVVAGALGLQLGGGHFYHGQWVDKPHIGEAVNDFRIEQIDQVNDILYVTSVITMVIAFLLVGGVNNL